MVAFIKKANHSMRWPPYVSQKLKRGDAKLSIARAALCTAPD